MGGRREHFGIILGPFWDNLGPFWDHFGPWVYIGFQFEYTRKGGRHSGRFFDSSRRIKNDAPAVIPLTLIHGPYRDL